MSTWKIYRTVSGAAQEIAECVSLEFHDIWMGEEFVTVSIVSPTPIELQVGDYLTYRGATYTIYSLPAALKQARSSSYGEAFKYDNVKLSARSTELTDIRFLDIVLGDNNLHYTSLPTFSVYCETVDDLVDRLQANTDRNAIQWFFITPSYSRTMQRYTGAAAVTADALWHQYYDDADDLFEGNTEINISVDKISLWQGLAFIKNNFGLNFITRDRSCIIGAPGIIANHIFQYGKGNGLYQIERVADQDQQIVTKLFAYGSDKNLPLRYYATIGDDMPNNMAVNVLMLPGFPQYALNELCRTTYYTDGTGNRHTKVQIRKTPPASYSDMTPSASYSDIMDILGEYTIGFSDNKLRPYITSGNVGTLGVKEGDIHFTEENDDNGLQEVYPSIEGMTAGDAGVSGLRADERLDEIKACDVIDDNGVFEEGAEIPNFNIYLKPLGFDLKQAYDANGGTMVIHLNDGYCGGREFAVKDVIANGTGWKLNVERSHDESLDLYFPYSWAAATGETPSSNEAYQIRQGDHFVLTEIEISDTSYIWAASVKALRKAVTWLLNNDYTRFTYLPKVDEIFMARQHDSSTPGTSLHDTLKAGDVMNFEDSDLDIAGNVFIDTLTIKENGNNGIPTYDVVLRNDKQVGTIQRIQNQLNTLSSFVNGGGGGMSIAQIRQLIQTYGADLFLSKLNDDTAQGFIRMMQGLQVGANFVPDILGEGGVFCKENDGMVNLVTDKLYVRVKAYFDTVEIRRFLHTGGNRIASVAGMKCCRMEWLDSSNNVLEQTDANRSLVKKFRCYFRASDGDDEVRNDFQIGDQAYCHVTSVATSSDNPEEKGLNQKHYWRLVIGRNTEGTLTDDGEAYIDLSNYETNTISGVSYAGYQSGSDFPDAQDDIIQLGNVNDSTRRGAIVEYVSGTDAPSYQIYQGLGTPAASGSTTEQKRAAQFSLNGKNYIGLGYNTATGRAYMNVYGDMYIGAKPDPQTGSPTYIEYKQSGAGGNPELNIKAKMTILPNSVIDPDTQIDGNGLKDYIDSKEYDDTAVQQFMTDTGQTLESLQDQIDGAIETYFLEGTPSLSAPPVVNPQGGDYPNPWLDGTETAAEREKILNRHTGDMYYDIADPDDSATSGNAYRFIKNGNNFEWQYIDDTAITAALKKAAEALNVAESKAKVFKTASGVLPPAPYKENDIWVNATGTWGSGASAVTWDNDILKCKNGINRTTDASRSINDWERASKYTDDTYAHGFDFLTSNLARLSSTEIAGGLVLSSLIGLRDTNNLIQSGINGIIDSAKKGSGIAAWYGGEQGDLEDQSHYSGVTRWAKSLFRFDGSGYLAGGNITWDENGIVTIANVYSKVNGTDIEWSGTTLQYMTNLSNLLPIYVYQNLNYIDPKRPFTALQIVRKSTLSNPDDSDVLTWGELKGKFVTKAFFEAIFKPEDASGNRVTTNGTTTNVLDRLKILVGTYTDQYLSALGRNDSGGGGGGASALYDLLDVQANSGGTAVEGAATGNVLTYDGNKWKGVAPTTGTVTSVKVGTTSYTPKNGVVSLPAYPTLSAATASALGGIKIGYSASGTNYAVALDANNKAYVSVPWTNTWRNVFIGGTEKIGTGTGTKAFNFVGDGKTTVSFLAAGTGEGQSDNANYFTIKISSTWRGIQDNLTSTSAVDSLSAKQGKVLKGLVDTNSGNITTLQGYFTGGVAKKAAKLSTVSKTLWGNTYWTSGGVPTSIGTSSSKASLNYVNNITMYGYLRLWDSESTHDLLMNWSGDVFQMYAYESSYYDMCIGHATDGGSALYFDASAASWGISTLTPVTKLDVSGGVKGTKFYLRKPNAGNDTNAIYFELDSNNAVHLVGAGFYTDSFVSALGLNSSGGGGGTGDVTWELLESNDTRPINISHLTGALSGYATTSWVSANFNNYVLPTATSSALGGVKVGTTLAISSSVLNLKSGIATIGTYPKVTVDTYGRVTSGTTLSASDIPNLAASKITSGTFDAARIPSLSWDKITSDKPTTLAGYGITDAKIASGVITLGSNTITPVTSVSAALSGDVVTLSKTAGGSTSTNTFNILERKYTVSYPQGTFTTEGWYRIGNVTIKAAVGVSCILFLNRAYNSSNNESYVFAITVAYNGGITISQIAGHYNTLLIDKIRVTYVSDNSNYYPNIDIHFIEMKESGNNLNATIVGGGHVLDATDVTYNPTLESGESQYVYDIVDGAGTSRNYSVAGSLSVGNAITLIGNTAAKRRIYFGDSSHYIELDSNGYFHFSHGLYSDSFVSALGLNSSGGGGGGGTGDVTWELLESNDTRPINISHLTGALSGYATTSWVNTQLGNYYSSTASRTANTVLAAPNGSAGAATFRALVAADIPNLNASKITAGTFAAARIPDLSGTYLPLSGGTMTGGITMGTSSSTAFNTKGILFGANGASARMCSSSTNLGIYAAGSIYLRPDSASTESSTGVIISSSTVTYNGNTIWHAGNDGASSGLDADLLDGTHKSDLFSVLSNSGTTISVTVGGTNKTLTVGYSTQSDRLYAAQIFPGNTSGDANTMQLDGEGTAYSVLTNYHSNSKWLNTPSNCFIGNYYGGVIELKGADEKLKMQFAWSALHNETTSPTKGLWFRAMANKGYSETDWHQVAMTDSNVASATKLQTARTIWGQDFDGTANVSGAISGATTISASSNVSVGGTLDVTGATTLTGNTTLGGNLYLENNKYVYFKDINSTNVEILRFTSGNNIAIGYGARTAASSTLIHGGTNGIQFRTNGTTARMFIDSAGNVGIGSTSPSYKLHVAGTFYASGNSSIGGTTDMAGSLTLNNNLKINFKNASGTAISCITLDSNNNLVLGESMASNSYNTYVRGNNVNIQARNASGGRSNVCVFTKDYVHALVGFYSDSYVSALGQNTSSDIRKKDIKESIFLDIDDIAAAPSVRYMWKENKALGLQVGSIAQYWQKVLPESVHEGSDGYLSMEYGVIALLASISAARKIQDHERRIKDLERENEILRKEVEQLKTA